MNHELAKTISTCVIWLSLACILTFGLFRINVNGDIHVFLVMFCLPILIVGGAVKATDIVWKSRLEGPAPASAPTPPNATPAARA